MCGILHAGVADIEVESECPLHKLSNIRLTGESLCYHGCKGDNFIEQETLCGDFPGMITNISCQLRTNGILPFALARQCMNPNSEISG